MKIKRLHILLFALTLIGVLVFVAPAIALADCSPSPTGGSDDIACSGTHFGSVNAGNGNDTVTVNPGANVTRDIDGGNGSDTITNNGRVGDDSLGGRGDDEPDGRGEAMTDKVKPQARLSDMWRRDGRPLAHDDSFRGHVRLHGDGSAQPVHRADVLPAQ